MEDKLIDNRPKLIEIDNRPKLIEILSIEIIWGVMAELDNVAIRDRPEY